MAPIGLVLLVGEDDAFAMYAEYLADVGFETALRHSPNEALAVLDTLTGGRVIVAELAFGGSLKAGRQFLKAIREQPATRQAALIVVSGYVRSQDAALAPESGADQFLKKPLLPDVLAQISRRWKPRMSISCFSAHP